MVDAGVSSAKSEVRVTYVLDEWGRSLSQTPFRFAYILVNRRKVTYTELKKEVME